MIDSSLRVFVIGCGWRSEVRVEKFSTEVGGWRLEVGGWRLEAGEGLCFCLLQKKFVLDETFFQMLR